MIVYRSLEEIPHDDRTVVTIGTFDGVHLGHREIINALTGRAAELKGRSLVVTFDPHPQEILRKTGDAVPILSTIREREAELTRLGVDALLVLEFTREFAAIPWQRFCELLLRHAGIRHMIVGHDHAFGKNREGNADSLREFGREHGFEVTEIGPLVLQGETVSSTKIRRALLEGAPPLAERYLGRPYSLSGRVVRGDGRGRTLGIPTANIRPDHHSKLIPADGVYCVRMIVDSVPFGGMANIGRRPTFTEGIEQTIEVNLFEFDRDIYDHIVTVEFRKFVRSEQKFGSGEEFMEQLGKDREICMKEFGMEKDAKE